jgi:hypothetical protein
MEGKSVDLLMMARRRLDVQANTAWTEFHPFRSAEARAEYFAALERRERRWPIASEDRVVETSWAKTFVRVGGPAGGRSASTARHRRVVALVTRSRGELRTNLVATLRLGRWDLERLREMAATYGTKAIAALIEECIAEARPT